MSTQKKSDSQPKRLVDYPLIGTFVSQAIKQFLEYAKEFPDDVVILTSERIDELIVVHVRRRPGGRLVVQAIPSEDLKSCRYKIVDTLQGEDARIEHVCVSDMQLPAVVCNLLRSFIGACEVTTAQASAPSEPESKPEEGHYPSEMDRHYAETQKRAEAARLVCFDKVADEMRGLIKSLLPRTPNRQLRVVCDEDELIVHWSHCTDKVLSAFPGRRERPVKEGEGDEGGPQLVECYVVVEAMNGEEPREKALFGSNISRHLCGMLVDYLRQQQEELT